MKRVFGGRVLFGLDVGVVTVGRAPLDPILQLAPAGVAAVGLAHLAMAVKHGSLMDDESIDHDVAEEFAGGDDLHPAGGLDVALDLTSHGDVAGLDVGLNDALFANNQVALVYNLAVDTAVDADAAGGLQGTLDFRAQPDDLFPSRITQGRARSIRRR